MINFTKKVRGARNIFIVSVTIIVIAFAINDNLLKKSPPLVLDGKDYLVERIQVRDLLEKQGPEAAFQVIKEAQLRNMLALEQCHAMLHGVGHIAYNYYGQNLKKVAEHIDGTCLTAYFHGVEAQIAIEHPDSFVPVLKELCGYVKSSHPELYCYHGAGHLFMQKINNAEMAVKKCDEIAPYPNPDIENCYGGVFSEFGNRVMNFDTDTALTLPGPPLIKFEYMHPMEYCLKFDKQYQASCARQLVKIKNDDTDIERSLGECTLPGLSTEIKIACITITATFSAENKIFTKQEILVPKFILAATPQLQEAYIWGVRTAVESYSAEQAMGAAEKFCEKFQGLKILNKCKEMLAA